MKITLNFLGVDVVGTITLLYPDNRVANLTFSYLTALKNNAVVYGTKGKLEVSIVVQ